MYVRSVSPARGLSPVARPKITFNYQPSPLRERPSYGNSLFAPKPCTTCPIASPKIKIENHFYEQKKQKQQDICLKCNNHEVTYKALNNGMLFCSKCAVVELSQGKQLTRIKLQEQPFFIDYHKQEKQNKFSQVISSPKIENFSTQNHREEELDSFLDKVNEEKQQLEQILDRLNSEQLAHDGVKFIYRNRKLALKKHYERIKEVIKISIEKDLQELERRESQSLKCVENNRKEIKENIIYLNQIRKDIEPNKEHIINGIVQKDYRILLSKHQKDKQRIAEEKEISLQLIKELAVSENEALGSAAWQSRVSQEQLEGEYSLYDPYNYTMFDTRPRKGQTLFSFEGKIK